MHMYRITRHYKEKRMLKSKANIYTNFFYGSAILFDWNTDSHLYAYIQWNLSVMDTTGTTWSVLIKEVSLFQRLLSTLLYVAGTTGSVLIRERFSYFGGP